MDASNGSRGCSGSADGTCPAPSLQPNSKNTGSMALTSVRRLVVAPPRGSEAAAPWRGPRVVSGTARDMMVGASWWLTMSSGEKQGSRRLVLCGFGNAESAHRCSAATAPERIGVSAATVHANPRAADPFTLRQWDRRGLTGTQWVAGSDPPAHAGESLLAVMRHRDSDWLCSYESPKPHGWLSRKLKET